MNPSTLLARLAVEALAAAGVRHVLLCPGSRSAPLAYELDRVQVPGAGTAHPGGDHPGARVPALHVRHDERVAAFTALGVGKDLSPGIGAVVTTSGTAAANLHPAVLEAHHAGVPLVVVTADRPVALRGTWANQTSELQAGLFGSAVRARLDLADEDAAKDPQAAAAALAAVLRQARGGGGRRPGPVHLDLGFSDPLVPDDDGPDDDVPDNDGPYGLPDVAPAARADAVPVAPPPVEATLVDALPAGPLTVVLAGDGAGPEAAWVAELSGWPLLAEPSSKARSGPNAIGPYRLLLELPELGGAVQRVLAFGRPTLSRPVTRLLARPDVDVVLVSPYGDWPDPGRPVRRLPAPPYPARVGPFATWTGPPTSPDADAWLTRWRAAGAAAAAALDGVLDGDPVRDSASDAATDVASDVGRGAGGAVAAQLTGPLVAREVWAALRRGETLVAAASNPIRDLDLTARPTAMSALRSGAPPVLANRGLSGIDGTLSTAIGAALSGGRVRVLVGDLAFLHDAGALLTGPTPPGSRQPDVQIVVLNDDGGGIFSLLEHGERATAGAQRTATFERVFGTPHGADLAALCRGYGVAHTRAGDVEGLRAVLGSPPPGLSVVEVRASRAGLRDLHARIRAAVHEAARDALTGGSADGWIS